MANPLPIVSICNALKRGGLVLTRTSFGPDATLDDILNAAKVQLSDRSLIPMTTVQRLNVRSQLEKALAPKKPKPKATKRLGYRECVEYIALNDDESMIMDGDPSVLVSMIGHLFEKDSQVVIADVRKYLEKQDA